MKIGDRGCHETSFRRVLLLVGLLSTVSVSGQPAPAPKPVTSPMLQNPDPADWLMWRRTLNSWGYSPLNQITRANVGRLRMVWTRGMGPGIQEADAAGARRRHVSAESQRLHPGHRRRHGRSQMGVQAQGARRPRQVHPRAQHQPESGHLRQPHHRYQLRRFCVRAGRSDRANSTGKRASSTIARRRRRKPRGPSSPTARFFRRADANTSSVPTAASSPRTTP